MVTLTNSSSSDTPDPLDRAGLGQLFAARFTVDPVRRFKPAGETYARVENAMSAAPDALCLIAAHAWDTIGAQSRGWRGVLLGRGFNAPLVLENVPAPDIVAPDLDHAAGAIIAAWG